LVALMLISGGASGGRTIRDGGRGAGRTAVRGAASTLPTPTQHTTSTAARAVHPRRRRFFTVRSSSGSRAAPMPYQWSVGGLLKAEGSSKAEAAWAAGL